VTERDPAHLREPVEEPPPLGSWGRMYALVLGVLAALILLFTLFTRAFS
jgi:hypothetical protein